MMLLQVLLFFSPLCLSLPINEDNNEMTTTNSSEPEVLPASAQLLFNLLPPSSIKDCITSHYCHQGNCAQGAKLSMIVKNYAINITDLDDSGPIFCICHSPYVDSEEGLCTIVGKSQETATAIRFKEILLFEKNRNNCSVFLGLLGGDWFYLSCGDAIFILIGLTKLLFSSIGFLLMCHLCGWYVAKE